VIECAALAAKWHEPPKDALDTLVLGAVEARGIDLDDRWELLAHTPFDPVLKRTEGTLRYRGGGGKKKKKDGKGGGGAFAEATSKAAADAAAGGDDGGCATGHKLRHGAVIRVTKGAPQVGTMSDTPPALYEHTN
jgi:H+-transporting ATPase